MTNPVSTESKNAKQYDFNTIETEIASLQAERAEFQCDSNGNRPYYALGMFPYPSGNAHLGHVRVYTISDARARYERLKGHEVLHPMGWDAFGLPAENAAIQRKVRPDLWTAENIHRMRDEQFSRLGWSFDLSREINTSSPDYYRWTQWIFLKFLEHGLAYKAAGSVNWCPSCETVLANEQVNDGRCWRCNSDVEKRRMDQWYLRITQYAERLWDDLPKLRNWNSEAVAVQRNWINRSVGVSIDFKVDGEETPLTVYTTRADTLFGVVAIVVAPEHPIVASILARTGDEDVARYVQTALRKSSVDRLTEKEKTGVRTRISAVHPLTGKSVPVWIGDYVIADYGSGAVMCVPAHDERDFEFAHKYGLEIIDVVAPAHGAEKPTDAAFTDDGVLIASDAFSGMTSAEARDAIAARLEAMHAGRRTVNFNLRDWSVGRQRYWGCPIPVINCPDCGPVGVPENELPVLLPTDVNLEGGKARIPDDSPFRTAKCPKCGGMGKRETDTLDTFMCSAWYAFRFVDPKNDHAAFSKELVDRWMPVDFYVGGLEHAAQHMLYFRFFTKFFNDIGLVSFDEPVDRFFCNGMVRKDGEKMSKSRGNVVVPTEAVDRFGADALRFYMMSDTPSDLDIDWDDGALHAKERFIRRTYSAMSQFLNRHFDASYASQDLAEFDDRALLVKYMSTLAGMEQDLLHNQFHNCVARIHELANILVPKLAEENPSPANARVLCRLIHDYVVAASVLMPFHTEHLLRHGLHDETPIYDKTWPRPAERFLRLDEFECVVQINGKKRDAIQMPRGVNEKNALAIALASPTVQNYLQGREPRRVIYVSEKLLNIVA